MTLPPDVLITGVAPDRVPDKLEPTGERIWLDGEEYYRISAYDRMPPFLMSITSDTDLWMFITSMGGLTAGRMDADGALFPYETVDRLHDGHHHTGPLTLIRLKRREGPEILWRLFAERTMEGSRIGRNLYKNTLGNRLIFEEIHHDLDVAFRYRWSGSDEFGLVRTATLVNLNSEPLTASVLDGLRNVLPHGAPLALYQQSSSLVDAYKRTDCDPDTRMGIFSLTSKIVDRPEAAEQLRANTVWCHGLGDHEVCLSLDAVGAFERGEPVTGEQILTGRRGNYLTVSEFELAGGDFAKWHMVADVGRSHVQVQALRARLLEGVDLDSTIENSLDSAGENLMRIVAKADGLQLTGNPESTSRHVANVLFNNMRGGVFAENYAIPADDFMDFLRTRNRPLSERWRDLLEALPERIVLNELLERVEETQDADLQRLAYEYLPLYFGRRHGDPSRPWNRFSIHVRNENGGRALRYEGNWRDIFQNWEALCLSFPAFLPSIIAKFVNASTVTGFNPYRITRDGVDWEVEDPEDFWSHIGYWGDHQIVYLLKFLEASARYLPGSLEAMLGRKIFSYADVPYRIEPYEKILRDPHATIVYDHARASRIEDRVEKIAADGKLLPGPEGSVHHTNLLEKLLVPALSKLSNLVPDAGIWMNTQRPEWNDANNALVGNGVSVVTLCYLRRYLSFLAGLLDGDGKAAASISIEVADWLRQLRSILAENRPRLEAGTLNDRDRKTLLDALGRAFSAYRETVYDAGFSGKEREVPLSEIVSFCGDAIEHLDHAIRANRREDGLYHAYNLLRISGDGTKASIGGLYEMLEGQVAALSSGVVDSAEAVELITSLYRSPLYREDQRSFLLYPERELPAFLERNVIPDESVRGVSLLSDLIEAKESSIVARDALGVFRFHGDFRNAGDLAAALDRLAKREAWTQSVERNRQAVLDVFESVFDHRSFTGRSGTMYAYEGLGCVYWHMVAKLLLAVQESILRAVDEGGPASIVEDLVSAYFRIRSGLGFEKTVLENGAFPMDPYSHTPPHGGARQPGMTGQVKEEILTRFGELGVRVENGIVGFRPVLLRRGEFSGDPGRYRYWDLTGQPQTLEVPAGGLAFTFCQVPIVYTVTEGDPWIRVAQPDGASTTRAGDRLDTDQSRSLFQRLGHVARIDVGVPEQLLVQLRPPSTRE